ncbi:MAG: LamG-like jellyroll fold domain-containing protein, partial [Bacteroidota bacterium]
MPKLLTTIMLGFIAIATQAQVFYYPFNNGNTDNEIDNGFSTLFPSGTSPVDDPLGNANSAMSFAGSGAELWVNSGDLIDFGLTTSFSFLTSFYSNSTENQDFFSDLLANGVGWQVGIYNDSGYVTFRSGDGNTAVLVRTEQTYNDGEWHHLGLLVDKSNMTIRMFIDGEPSMLVAEICGEELMGTEISIEGCNFNANEDNSQLTAIGDDLVGGMDEIMLFPSLISDAQVIESYAGGFIEQPSLNWPLNNANNINPTEVEFMWESLSTALSYEIEYDVNMNFNDPVILETNTNSAVEINLMPAAEYFWRVRAITDLGTSL